MTMITKKDDDVKKLVEVKIQLKDSVNTKFKPFFAFTSIKGKSLLKIIKEEHDKEENFNVTLLHNRILWKELNDAEARASKTVVSSISK